ncbi:MULTISPECIES: type II toxin-antitoxin system RelE/ParE family toxin [unclassified Pseudomonas]|uniref:type II toxin-antitoxin system RelE/ParE family toxin n=1 Tax=unclassified Pseudomonas TaxID=196821 RepID=UPI000A1D6DB4|nr:MULTISPECIES: type II toxin-antitoxin system RelE/ParE family toxin [unclassified Pseudomonas]
MLNVALTERAENDLDVVHEYDQRQSGANAAFAAVDAILQSLDRLSRFPGSGRPSVLPDIRELVVSRYPFVAPYRFVQGQVQVLRILHQRTERPQDW